MSDTLASILKQAEAHGILQRKVVKGGETEYLPTHPGEASTANKAMQAVMQAEKQHTGAMLALYPDTPPQFSLADSDLEPTAPDELHVTMAYLGDAADLDEEDRAFLRRVCEQIASEFIPIQAKLGGIGRFLNLEDDDTQAYYASVDSPDIEALRARLVEVLGALGLLPDSDHGFTPHMTLAYVPVGKPAAGAGLQEEPVEFGGLSLSLGGEREDFPFKASGAKQNIMLTYPDENKTQRFVWQQHFRGKSSHGDFRVQSGDYLVGWTIPDQNPGAITEPVETLAQATTAVNNPDLWKMNLATGEIKPREIRSGVVRKGDLRALPKGVEIPEDWLNEQGVTDKPDPGEAIPVGATRNYPGVFKIVDKGTVEHGAKKSWMAEYWIHGDKWGTQRWLFRLLERGKGDGLQTEGWEEEAEEVGEAVKYEPGQARDEAGRFAGGGGGGGVSSFSPSKSLRSEVAEWDDPVRASYAKAVINRVENSKGRTKGLAVKDADGKVEGLLAYTENTKGRSYYKEPHIELDLMVAKPGSQGVGSKLLTGVKEEAARRKLPLVVNSTTASSGFYEKAGLDKVTGQRGLFVYKPSGVKELLKLNPGELDLWLSESLPEVKAEVLPPGVIEQQPRSDVFWVFMQPDDQTPYVLGKEAVDKDWLPPKGVSALPKAIRERVPKELRFWETSGKEALDRRAKLAEMDIRELGGSSAKYSPNQPRDEAGRFGSSGGGSIEPSGKVSGKNFYSLKSGDRLPDSVLKSPATVALTPDGKLLVVEGGGVAHSELAAKIGDKENYDRHIRGEVAKLPSGLSLRVISDYSGVGSRLAESGDREKIDSVAERNLGKLARRMSDAGYPSDMPVRWYHEEGGTATRTTLEAMKSFDEEKQLDWHPYKLQRHWWRGQVVIRFGPSDQSFDLWLDQSGKPWHLVVEGNPLTNDRLPAYEESYSPTMATADGKRVGVLRIGSDPVELAPGQPANPTKDTPAFIQTVDEGEARLIDDQPEFKKIEFKDGKLKSAWYFRLESPDSKIGEFGKSEGPQVGAKYEPGQARDEEGRFASGGGGGGGASPISVKRSNLSKGVTRNTYSLDNVKGSELQVVKRPDGSRSVATFLIPESERGRGYGQQLLLRALKDGPIATESSGGVSEAYRRVQQSLVRKGQVVIKPDEYDVSYMHLAKGGEKGIRPLFGSPGGKRLLAKTIVDLIPPHKVYVEPFAGGAAVLFAKPPEMSEKEVLADADPDIAFAYRTVKGLSDAEIERLNGMEWRIGKFDEVKDSRPDGKLGKLHRWLFLRRMSQGKIGEIQDSGRTSEYGSGWTGSKAERMPTIRDRLASTQIRHSDYKDSFKEWDGKDTFFYLDPPYPETDLGAAKVGLRWTDEDCTKFADALKSLKGKWLVSLQDNATNRNLFKSYHIRGITVPRSFTTAGNDGTMGKELLIANYPLPKRVRRKSMDDVEALQLVYTCMGCKGEFESEVVLEEPVCPDCSAKALPWQPYLLQRHNDHYDLRIGDDFTLRLSGTLLDNEPDKAEVSTESPTLQGADGQAVDALKVKPGDPVKLDDGEIQTLDKGQARYAKTQAGHQVEFKGGKLEGVYLFGPEGAHPLDLEHIDVEWEPGQPEPAKPGLEPFHPPLIPIHPPLINPDLIRPLNPAPPNIPGNLPPPGMWYMGDGEVAVGWKLDPFSAGEGDKFSQPRDDLGRFASTGGGGGGEGHAGISRVRGSSSEEVSKVRSEVSGWKGARRDIAVEGTKWAEAGNDMMVKRDSNGKMTAVATLTPKASRKFGYPPNEKYKELITLATVEKGHGREMMQNVFEDAAKSKAGIVLTSSPAARGFYEKMGFRPGGQRNEFVLNAAEVREKVKSGGKAEDDEPSDGVFAVPSKRVIEGEKEPFSLDDFEEDEKVGKRIKTEKLSKLQELRQALSNAIKELGEILGWAEHNEAQPTMLEFFKGSDAGFTVKTVQGEPWLFTWSANAFKDREGEIFSTKALENWADAATARQDKGSFNFWHIPGTDFAVKRWVGVPGRILVEAGPFIQDEKGQAAQKFFAEFPDRHPTLAPEGWGCSVEYRYLPEERKKGVYQNVEITRTSVLPRFAAANTWTAVKEVTMALTDAQKKAAQELFGEDLAASILGEAEAKTKELEPNVAHKGDGEQTEPEVQPEVQPEAAAAEEAQPVAEEDKAKKKPKDAAMADGEPYPKPTKAEKKQLDQFVKAIRDVAASVTDDSPGRTAILEVADKLSEENLKDMASELKKAGKAVKNAAQKARLTKLVEAMAGDGTYPAPGEGDGEGYPYPTKSKELVEEVAAELAKQFKLDLVPVGEALTATAAALKGLEDRITALETQSGRKAATDLPRFVFGLVEQASKADATIVPEGDKLLDQKPKETSRADVDGSIAAHFFPKGK